MKVIAALTNVPTVQIPDGLLEGDRRSRSKERRRRRSNGEQMQVSCKFLFSKILIPQPRRDLVTVRRTTAGSRSTRRCGGEA